MHGRLKIWFLLEKTLILRCYILKQESIYN